MSLLEEKRIETLTMKVRDIKTGFGNPRKIGKKEAEEHGAIFVYPDTNEFREKCQPLLDSIANQSDMTKDIYNKVEALREEN